MRNALPWLPVALLAVAVCAAAALHVARQPPPPLPPPPVAPIGLTVGLPPAARAPLQASELVHDYHSRNIDVRSAPVRDGDPADLYLFFDGGPADPVPALEAPLNPEQADLWRDVILVRYHPDRRLDGPLLTSWRNCGLRVGPYLMFGDPGWIARTREILLKEGRLP